MQAYVYKSLRKPDTYVYLRKRDDFLVVPEAVRQPLGELAFVLEVALTPERRLARADAAVVRANLAAFQRMRTASASEPSGSAPFAKGGTCGLAPSATTRRS